MGLSDPERRLLAALEEGLPLLPRPFAALAERAGLEEARVIALLGGLRARGVINRAGLILRHHELGLRANAMVVLDVPDAEVEAAGQRLAQEPAVSLCYRRPRRPPLWPYNLFCMVHGRERAAVARQVAAILERAGLAHCPHALLFSARRFKQTGARYSAAAA